MKTHGIPDGLPVLSRGKHRNPRKGACFMEMASVLANEPWSDRPSCTHPLLAQLARLVNDHTNDDRRGELVVLIPDVVGVQGHGLDWEAAVTAAVACRALPDIAEESQRALAAGLIRCDEVAAHGGPTAVDREAIREALDQVPLAATWARGFIDGASPLKPKSFQKHSAPAVMLCAVRGTARAAVSDPDAHLRDLLVTGIEAARRVPAQPLRNGTSSLAESSSYVVPKTSTTTTSSPPTSNTARSV
ncbi:hypothetical protein [Nocardioides sp. YIM 152315]|uniref:hypothetical protein n=1 Tax=Nocardioides sp. YIM 152315 TaxID=3031760 RepID=UPI0023DBC96C|nr:hypothetical protein [Nocardioides sp. YIM 152315]MDF1605325.1 hypothetical protein [Nocardioides sp. YIM 152315]